MPIACPHCATSYAVDPATLGFGRNARCARCKRVWLAQPQSLPEPVSSVPEPAGPESALVVPWGAPRRALVPANDVLPAIIDGNAVRTPTALAMRRPARRQTPLSILPTAALAMGALIASLVVWRAEMVRLMPQTAGFYRIIGLDANPRGLLLRNVKLNTDSVDGTPVLMVEGTVESRRGATVELPRLRFVVRNSAGTEIYGWNAKLDIAALKPGETAAFRSRLASPPADAHSIDVRFLNRRDLATGAV